MNNTRQKQQQVSNHSSASTFIFFPLRFFTQVQNVSRCSVSGCVCVCGLCVLLWLLSVVMVTTTQYRNNRSLNLQKLYMPIVSTCPYPY